MRRPHQGAPIDAAAVAVAERAILSSRSEREASRILAAACHVTRLRIVRALAETPMAASDLARITGRTASGASQHIRVLREIGAVTADRRGNVVRYRLSNDRSAQILESIARAFDAIK